MLFDFLKKYVIEYNYEGDEAFSWNCATHAFARTCLVSPEELHLAQDRLTSAGYELPDQLKSFWTEIGCGYLCSNFLADNVIENPKAMLDVYFSEGDWAEVKTSFVLFVPNEFPFCRTSDFNYITIGIEKGKNFGEIYLNGEKIADSLSDFITQMLENPIYYERL